jgi:hypothetical protein
LIFKIPAAQNRYLARILSSHVQYHYGYVSVMDRDSTPAPLIVYTCRVHPVLILALTGEEKSSESKQELGSLVHDEEKNGS